MIRFAGGPLKLFFGLSGAVPLLDRVSLPPYTQSSKLPRTRSRAASKTCLGMGVVNEGRRW